MKVRQTSLERRRPAARAGIGHGMVRVGILAEIPALVRHLGHDPLPLLHEAGVDPALLHDPDNPIAFLTGARLIELGAERTGCAHFGLLLGQRGGAETLGQVGQLARHLPDVGAALQAIVDYLHHHDRGAVPTLSTAGGLTLLGYAIYERGVPSCDQVYATAIAITCQIMRALCGPAWRPAEVLLPFRRPRDTRPYRRFFRAPLRFSAEQAALAFPTKLLARKIAGGDPARGRAIMAGLDALAPPDLVDHVRRALRAMLAEGGISEQSLASAFSVNRRTLVRWLREAGTSFHELQREVRLETACQLLHDTDGSIADIAGGLGYSGASAFTRAFRGWTGIAPARWRKRIA